MKTRTDDELIAFAKHSLEMKRARQRRYFERNRDRLLASGREYREANRDEINFRKKLRRCGVS